MNDWIKFLEQQTNVTPSVTPSNKLDVNPSIDSNNAVVIPDALTNKLKEIEEDTSSISPDKNNRLNPLAQVVPENIKNSFDKGFLLAYSENPKDSSVTYKINDKSCVIDKPNEIKILNSKEETLSLALKVALEKHPENQTLIINGNKKMFDKITNIAQDLGLTIKLQHGDKAKSVVSLKDGINQSDINKRGHRIDSSRALHNHKITEHNHKDKPNENVEKTPLNHHKSNEKVR